MQHTKTIEKVKDGYIINDKYIIHNDGIIYYTYYYTGRRGDFPQYLFNLKNELLKMED